MYMCLSDNIFRIVDRCLSNLVKLVVSTNLKVSVPTIKVSLRYGGPSKDTKNQSETIGSNGLWFDGDGFNCRF